MKGTHLGEFEELVMLIVGLLYDDAYGVAIKNEIRDQSGRRVTLSAVHSALHRLVKKGFLSSRFGEPTKVRGGKRKKLFCLTSAGVVALQSARTLRNGLWKHIPAVALKI